MSAWEWEDERLPEEVEVVINGSQDEDEEEQYFYISFVATVTNMHQQTIRHYEKMGLIKPRRSQGNRRLYTLKDVKRMMLIKKLSKDMGINLAGIEVILNLLDQIEEMKRRYEARIRELQSELYRYKALFGELIEE